METAVNKLEAMFQKAEADLEYVEKQLKFECMTNLPEDGAAEENPVKLLESLSAVKARHKSLCAQMEAIAREQQESMQAIRAHLDTTVTLVQELQSTADVQVPPLTEAQQVAAEQLGVAVLGAAEASLQAPPPLEAPAPPQPAAQSAGPPEELTEADLTAVPRGVRSNLRLPELNALYRQLQEHFTAGDSRGALSLQQMRQMNMKPSDAKLNTLQHLSLITLDKKGRVRLAARD
ncbi:SKA complex subunit 2 [Amia ocellicauda]|uniref:SKA complex subunit 2 n=1 Tax=Amia ocellicauda TaxID=2972642 RepID=UPI0034643466